MANTLSAMTEMLRYTPKLIEEDCEDAVRLICSELLVTNQKTTNSSKVGADDWVSDADLEDECRAKLEGMKFLSRYGLYLLASNRQGKSQPEVKKILALLFEFVVGEGEAAPDQSTKNSYRTRLRLQAALEAIKLATQPQYEVLMDVGHFQNLSITIQVFESILITHRQFNSLFRIHVMRFVRFSFRKC